MTDTFQARSRQPRYNLSFEAPGYPNNDFSRTLLDSRPSGTTNHFLNQENFNNENTIKSKEKKRNLSMEPPEIKKNPINYPENNNIMHLMFETHNVIVYKLRKSNIHFKKLYKYDIPNFNDIPENIKSTFNELKFIKNNKNMIPLNNLLYGHIWDSSNYSYVLSLKDFINISHPPNVLKMN